MAEALQDDIFLDTAQAAKLLNLSSAYLVKLRFQGGGCVYQKFGRIVRYKRVDLLAWAAKHERRNTYET